MNTSETYSAAGVDTGQAENALSGLLGWLNQTFTFPGAVGRPVMENGFYANVHDLGNGLGVAFSTDGVGTKLLVAELLGRYDTVGIDCVAMNVNDILCVGARPIALVDYLAVQRVDGAMLEQLGRGLHEGARQAGVAIASGELAQIPEMLRGSGTGFDIAAAAIGVVALDRIIDGSGIRDGDVVIGFRSSGLHSNGYTLARRVLLGETPLDEPLPALAGATLAQELLRPTLIYVKPVLAALEQTSGITGLAHVTGDSFLNLLRLRTACGFDLTTLPPPHPVFALIQRLGPVDPAEMYQVFNMGIGFCVVCRPDAADTVLGAAAAHGYEAQAIGHARSSMQGVVSLPAEGLVADRRGFRRA
ncbi:MAG: phosphoribosylformylglycinamidine cyclo-ligase [Chloroflexota bacterium]